MHDEYDSEAEYTALVNSLVAVPGQRFMYVDPAGKFYFYWTLDCAFLGPHETLAEADECAKRCHNNMYADLVGPLESL